MAMKGFNLTYDIKEITCTIYPRVHRVPVHQGLKELGLWRVSVVGLGAHKGFQDMSPGV